MSKADASLMPDSGDDPAEAPLDSEATRIEATIGQTTDEAPESRAEEDADDGTPSEESGKLQKRLSDTEQAFKDKQAELTRVSQQVAELKGQMSVLMTQKEPAPEQDWLEDESHDPVFNEDPAANARALLKRFRGEVAKVLDSRDKYFTAKMQELEKQTQVTSMAREKAQMKPAFDALGDKPWFQNLPPIDQVNAAKEYFVMMSKATAKPEPKTGSPAGTGRRVTQDKQPEKELSEEMKSYLIAARAMSDGSDPRSLI